MEKDIGKIKKNDITDIVVRIDDFGGRAGLTIREFTSSDRYTGFTKSGTRIPVDSFNEFKEMINSITDEDINAAKEAAAASAGASDAGSGQGSGDQPSDSGQDTL
tara:strand:+ start:100 stop:414 length:315 start_codon:yes stop_codon:yes gene_type:complete